jgi:hypothetical protein
MKSRGQGFILFIVLLPVFVLLAAVIIRTGLILVGHQRLQSHCQRKILDALALQGKALEQLGRINPVAKEVIDLKRELEVVVMANLLDPFVLVPAENAIAVLKSTQKAIAVAQESIIKSALAASALELTSSPDLLDLGRSSEKFEPKNIFLSHHSKKALLLHITPLDGYANETGHPYRLDDDFGSRQAAWGTITMKTNRYDERWKLLPVLPKVEIQCRAQIQMQNLEAKWTARLTNPEDKL